MTSTSSARSAATGPARLGTVTVHGRDIEISFTLADGFCATARPQTGTILTFSSRRLGWHGFQSSPLSFGAPRSPSDTTCRARGRPRLRPAALSAEGRPPCASSASPSRRHSSTSRRSGERVSARCDEIEAKIGAAVDAFAQAPAKGMSPAAMAAAAKAAAHAGETGSADIKVHR